jgi:iron(III) transport system ATP-binding protein
VRDLDLTVEEGSFFVLLGPSGCGKSTLLRCVAGLEQPEEGEIRLGERLVYSARDNVSVDPEDREVAMVFQTYAVWPHMTVFENVAFPLTEAKKKRFRSEQVAAKVKEALVLVRLSGFERHSAATLSGGQQQRVALARALIREPKLLLMDEPLSNLDAKLREEMRDEIKELTRSLGVTTLHVTHDQIEAMALADLMAVMYDGKILEIGQPEALYRNPGNRSVAEFLGRTNWLSGVVAGNGTVTTEMGLVKCPLPNRAGPGSRASLGIRPEWVELTAQPCRSANSFAGTIEGRMFLGDAVLYWVRVGESRMMVKTTLTEFSIGSRVSVVVPAERWVVFSETA